jgi:HNH endonuclease
MTNEERFWAKVDRRDPGECWEWKASGTLYGYGSFRREGRWVLAHRVAWELANGPIPAGLVVLHQCDNPACVNPAHLRVDTQAANMRDKVEKGRQVSGDQHWTRLRPDRRARGERHGSRTHPERVARGDRHGSRLHPESRPFGERQGRSKLTELKVIGIMARWLQGETQRHIAKEYGVHYVTVHEIVRGKTWAHVFAPEECAR